MSLLQRFFALNPHLRLAIMMAPAMAVLGFVLAGYFSQSETNPLPSNALQLVHPECNPQRTECVLAQGGFELRLRITREGDSAMLALKSNEPLQGSTVEITGAKGLGPMDLKPEAGNRQWREKIEQWPDSPGELRLAVATASALYFAQLSLSVKASK